MCSRFGPSGRHAPRGQLVALRERARDLRGARLPERGEDGPPLAIVEAPRPGDPHRRLVEVVDLAEALLHLGRCLGDRLAVRAGERREELGGVAQTLEADPQLVEPDDVVGLDVEAIGDAVLGFGERPRRELRRVRRARLFTEAELEGAKRIRERRPAPRPPRVVLPPCRE